MIGHGELIVIVLVILVLFGATAIPKFARSLGLAKKEFNKAMREAENGEGNEASLSKSAGSPPADKIPGEKKEEQKV